MCWIGYLFGNKATIERPSPKIRVTPEQANASMQALKLIPGYENCFIAALAPSNSMEPGLDDGMYVLMDRRPYTDLVCGDIIWYEQPDYAAIHRIVKIFYDDSGWCCTCKGDNNSVSDNIKVRWQDIKGVWRATIN